MQKSTILRKAISFLLCFAMVLSYLPAMSLNASAADLPLSIVSGSKKSDPSTIDDWEQFFGPNKMDTEFAGAVWTDKSVYAQESADLPGVRLDSQNNFLVALSAIASNLSITGHTSSPTDTMLVLDLSGSMVDGTYEVGTIRRGNNYQTVEGIDMSLIEAMVEATNDTIDQLMKQNTNNRVGVVLYSGNTSSNQDATAASATVVLPLDRYTGINGEYLSVDTTWTTSTLYTWRSSGWFGGSWVENGEATYVAEDTSVSVSVKNGLTTETGSNVTDRSKEAVGGTYIQNGLYQAMNQFLAVTDTTVPEGKPQAGVERMPVLVLMTDGAPTIASSSYNSIGDSDVGNGTSTTDRITFLTQLTAAYVRGRIAAKYQESASDDDKMLFLTLGLGTENSTAATNTLYPAGSNSTLVEYWDRYLAGTAGRNVQIATGQNGWSVYRDAAVEAMNYVDKYFYASDAQGLLESFSDIISEIELKAESYATLVESTGANFSGYVTFDDELGEMMHVADVKGIFMNDGNGNRVLYTGMGVAKSMTEGSLGTVDTPNARGDELVRTVKERIPGLTTTQAQQLIGYAYSDSQLYYIDDNNWSNYIGWYADANGQYVGFWDKDSGYENAPAGAVYANRSYGYLGVNGDSDMMHVVVMVSTDLRTLGQKVSFKIPASLLPTVQYRVTLHEDDPNQVEDFQREGTIPMQLVFEAGLPSDINSVNLEQKIAQHLQRGGHVHRNEQTGAVTFFTNEWDVGNDDNHNGIPDPEEVDDAIVTQSHFHPALDNSRYYYTEDTVILTGNDERVTGTTRPSGTGYYYHRYIYSATGRQVINTPIAATTLANDALYDAQGGYWYIPSGTMYHNLQRFRTVKAENPTNTLDYSFFPAVFDSVSKQDVYTFLGNNGSITAEPATGITLTKQVQGAIAGTDRYTFRITVSDPNAVPLVTDANGNTLADVTVTPGQNGQFTVTMPANVTAYISGIGVGTQVTVKELIGGDYHVVSIQVAGQDQTAQGMATATIPAYTNNGSQMVPVLITNAPNQYGDLVISKDVLHNLASDPEALATKAFTFRVQLSGDKLTAGDIFLTSNNGAKVKLAQDLSLTYEDGTPIRLTNEESITIYGLPAGTGYTITEEALPGFKLDNINGNAQATAATGTIVANDEQLADFYNRYPDQFRETAVPLKLDVTKILNRLSTYTGNEQFRFALQMLLSDNTYSSIEADNGEDYVTVSADSTASGAYTLEFDRIGTYFFQVVELVPDQKTPGMTYSTTRALFRVEVTDTDMDGTLEVAVREEANVDEILVSSVGNDPEQITSVNVKVSFTNTYELGSVSTSLNVHKELENPANANKPLTDFSFTLYPSDASGNVAAGAQGTKVTSSALGDATFNLLLEQEGTFYYKVVENIPQDAVLNTQTGKYEKNGMAYDATEYLFTVVTRASVSGDLEITQRTLVNLATNQPVEPVSGAYTAHFANTYTLTPTEIYLPLRKNLTGRAPESGENYGTYLVRTNSAFQELSGADAWNASYYVAANSQGNVKLSFEKVGTYHYKWTEIIPQGAVRNPETGRYVYNGVSYDPAQYHITVTVSDNGNGALAANTVIHKLGQTAAVNTVTFSNTYSVTGTGNVTFGGMKDLDGRALVAGEFTIGLYADAACTQQIATTTNRADGTFSFPTISYSSADLGENNAAKTYTYYVKEVPGSKGGVTYDPTVYTVSVTVSHDNGVLTVTPSSNATTLQIANTYKAAPVKVTLSGKKELSGDWTAVQNKAFTFQLFRADEHFVITSQTPVKTATVNGAEAFRMELDYNDGDEGFYYFVLKEDISVRAGGIGYDAGEYHITVNISDPGDGHLVALVNMYRPGTGNTKTAIFTNSYSVAPATVKLEGSKRFTNTTNNQPIAVADDQFSFVVLEVQDPQQTDLTNASLVTVGYSEAGGSIAFPEIRYTAAGIHHYKVLEVPGNAGGVQYDQTVFDVTVTVTDNGDGTLTAAANYNGKAVSFANTYTPGAAQVTIQGTKDFTGDWTAVQDKQFIFELYQTGANFATDGITPQTTINGTDGSFSFNSITYTVADTYYYVLMERSGAADKGITYDAKKVEITVAVTDDGNGKLIPTVTTNDTGASVTADASNSSLVTLADLVFTNHYQAKPATYTLEAQKTYERPDTEQMKAFTFQLSVNGDPKQTKQNDAAGKVAFDELSFATAGVYELKVREQIDLLWGLIRWDTNVYTVTLHVEDNGLGQLSVNESKTVITSDKGTGDLQFRNAHHEVITQKDVFLPSAPQISIDGKAVGKGEILLYKISYTNFDSVPVDVQIIDTVPQHTAYVEGSADNGGTFASGKLTWALQGVQPDATVTVSFRVKVTGNEGQSVENQATILEGQNTYITNKTSTPVKEDTFLKDAFLASAPTVSIDGKTVEQGDTLIYRITYTNNDDLAAKVTVTDTIPAHTAYVTGSADNGGVYESGKLTWVLELEPGATKTVSFKVKVTDHNATITNQAAAVEGQNQWQTNSVTTKSAPPPTTPDTGDHTPIGVLVAMLLVSGTALCFLALGGKKKKSA